MSCGHGILYLGKLFPPIFLYRMQPYIEDGRTKVVPAFLCSQCIGGEAARSGIPCSVRDCIDRVPHGELDTQCRVGTTSCVYRSDSTNRYTDPYGALCKKHRRRCDTCLMMHCDACYSKHLCVCGKCADVAYSQMWKTNRPKTYFCTICKLACHTISPLLVHDHPQDCHPTFYTVCCLCETLPHIRTLRLRQLSIPFTYCAPGIHNNNNNSSSTSNENQKNIYYEQTGMHDSAFTHHRYADSHHYTCYCGDTVCWSEAETQHVKGYSQCCGNTRCLNQDPRTRATLMATSKEEKRVSPAHYYVPIHRTHAQNGIHKSDCACDVQLENETICCQCAYRGRASFLAPHVSIVSRSGYLLPVLVPLVVAYMGRAETQEDENLTRCLNFAYDTLNLRPRFESPSYFVRYIFDGTIFFTRLPPQQQQQSNNLSLISSSSSSSLSSPSELLPGVHIKEKICDTNDSTYFSDKYGDCLRVPRVIHPGLQILDADDLDVLLTPTMHVRWATSGNRPTERQNIPGILLENQRKEVAEAKKKRIASYEQSDYPWSTSVRMVTCVFRRCDNRICSFHNTNGYCYSHRFGRAEDYSD